MIFYKGQARQYDIKIQVAEAGAHVQSDETRVKWHTVFSGKTPRCRRDRTKARPCYN